MNDRLLDEREVGWAGLGWGRAWLLTRGKFFATSSLPNWVFGDGTRRDLSQVIGSTTFSLQSHDLFYPCCSVLGGSLYILNCSTTIGIRNKSKA